MLFLVRYVEYILLCVLWAGDYVNTKSVLVGYR
jgi:hypothetical protein